MPHYAIGDIQGCFDPLQELLAIIAFNPNRDTLWLTGDLVNRGPKSLEVLRFIKNLPRAFIVLGNHDLALLALAYTEKPIKYHTLDSILAAPDREELLTWLRCQPLYHEDNQLNYIMVHAGIPPQWTMSEARGYAQEVEKLLQGDCFIELLQNMYGNEPTRWDSQLQGWDRYRFIINGLTRLRFCHQDGVIDLEYKGNPRQAPHNLKPWYEISQPPPPDKRIIFGHWAALEGKATSHYVEALDTGCVWGQCLTALRLGDNKRFTVKCPSS